MPSLLPFLPGLAALSLACSLAASPATAPRPNILCVVSEDNSPRYVGAYGNPLARTPAIDRLARVGILYTNTHSAAPVCAPARSTLITGRYASAIGTQAMRSNRRLPAGTRFFPELLRAAGYFCTNNAKTDYNTSASYAAAWDESSPEAHWRRRRPGQPFFAVFNFMQSHESRLQVAKPLTTDTDAIAVPAYLPDTPEVRATIAQYYDCVARADVGIGRILSQLAEDGLDESTIVVYYSDNGGAVAGSKRFLRPSGTHVPFVMYFPPAYAHLAPAAPGSRVEELVSFVDVAPTVLHLAGVDVPPGLDGRILAGPARQPPPRTTFVFRDRMDERFDISRGVTDGRYYYVRHYLPHLAEGRRIEALWKQPAMQSWVTQHRTLQLTPVQEAFFAAKPVEALYDCAMDPDGVRNLADEPSLRAIRDELRRALHSRLLQIRDTGFLPEMMLPELLRDRPATEVTHDDHAYPLDRILEMLDAAQLGHSSDRNQIAEAARDSRPVVRYWACVASLTAGMPAVATSCLHDESPAVRLIAADVVLRSGGDPVNAWDIVRAALSSDTPPPLRLWAANTLADHPQAPDAAVAALEALLDVKETYYGPTVEGAGNYYQRLLRSWQEHRLGR